MQDGGNKDLELFLQAVRRGLLSGAQLQDCLHEWEERHGSAPGHHVCRHRLFPAERLRELGSASQAEAAVTERRVEVVMTCRECKAERTLTLEAAVRAPRCAGCSGALRFRPTVETSARPPRRAVPDEVRDALLDPNNRYSKYVILSKLGTDDRTHAAVIGLKRGIIEL